MRALIVDDEIYAREELEALLQETGEFTVVGKCPNAMEALQAIRKEKPEVLLLDIQMPVISGFELLSMIDEELIPIVVFITAYDEYALKAFDENALDYLLKPVEKGRLAKTVKKLKRMLHEGSRSIYAGPEIARIPCLLSNRIKLIDVTDIEYVRSDIAGVYVVCRNG
jgi:two-component system, LytTR family, response regulator